MIFLVSLMVTLGLKVYPVEARQLFTPEPGCKFVDHNKDFYKVVSQGRTVLWKKRAEPNENGYTNIALEDAFSISDPLFDNSQKKATLVNDLKQQTCVISRLFTVGSTDFSCQQKTTT